MGEAALAGGRLLRGRANFRWTDLFEVIQECGPRALPIVTLISFLVGLILAFMGAVQLQSFGASVYVADLVAIAATREMGCLMTGIIMAGRTGAAFAAQLGTMRVNEEIDALVDHGHPAHGVPRAAADAGAHPHDAAAHRLRGPPGHSGRRVRRRDHAGPRHRRVLRPNRGALSLTNFFIGVFKGSVFGVLVALSGCLRGMQTGRSAAAVGLAATSAVVTAIVLIVVADGIFAVVLNALKL